MKKDIHPNYNQNITAKCVCGFELVTGSVKKEIKTELCSKCHPFFTGKQKLVDSAQRVDKFLKKTKIAEEAKNLIKAQKEKKQARKEKKTEKEEK